VIQQQLQMSLAAPARICRRCQLNEAAAGMMTCVDPTGHDFIDAPPTAAERADVRAFARAARERLDKGAPWRLAERDFEKRKVGGTMLWHGIRARGDGDQGRVGEG